jgi:hypothetical protein
MMTMIAQFLGGCQGGGGVDRCVLDCLTLDDDTSCGDERRPMRIDDGTILYYCSDGCRRDIKEEIVTKMMMIARLLIDDW